MTLLGVEGVFSTARIQESTLPKEFHRYELSAGRGSRFGTVQKKRVMRHTGDFISRDALPLGGGGKKTLTDEDWVLDCGRKFDFESFWDYKLSINKQIANATYKRDLAMGKTPGSRETLKSETLNQNDLIL